MTIHEFASAQDDVIPLGIDVWETACPAHGHADPAAKLLIRRGEKVAIRAICASGCAWTAILCATEDRITRQRALGSRAAR